MAHWTEQPDAEKVRLGKLRSKTTNAANKDAAQKLRLLRRAASPFVTIAEFADLMQVARSTIDRYRKRRPAGFPQEFQPAGRVRFKRQEVLDWIESQPLW